MRRHRENFSSLVDILLSGRQNFPHKTAVIFGKKKISFKELFEEALRTATCLKLHGIKEADRVAILLDNSPDFITAYFGILLNRAIIVPVNHMFKREEIAYVLEDSGASGLITRSAYADLAQELSTIADPLKFILTTQEIRQTTAADFSPIHQHVSKETVAVFLYTSGTTGHPKAAMLSHANLLANIRSSSQSIRLGHNDCIICFLPLFHSFAATVCLLMPLYAGAKIALLKSPRPIRKLLRTIRVNRVTIFVGIPSLFGILKDMRLPWFLPSPVIKFLSPVRLAISGAAALPVEVFKGFERKFSIPLLEGYGLTEASPVVSLNPLKGPRKPGSIGLPLPGVQVKIIDENGRMLETGKEGELCVRGANVMQGYFRKEEDNRQVLRDGWLLTGDMARIDTDGYITIMGRKKEMVNVRGLNVYPREIEEVLYRHPAIKEAAVIGIPDPHKGEVPKGYVVLKNPQGLNEHQIIVYLKEHLASYKIPRKIEIRDTLPKNTSGKILKRVLADENAQSARPLR